MNGVNKAILLGRVGQDPEVNVFSGGKSAQFSVATTERGFKTRAGKEVKERTEWHRVVCFGQLAEVVEKYVTKGSSVYIEGKIRTKSFDDKNGQKRYITEIHADGIQMLDKRQEQTRDQTKAVETGGKQSGSEDNLPF